MKKKITKTELKERVKNLKELQKKDHNPYREANIKKFEKEIKK